MKSLPPFVQQLINNCPRAGNGVHTWLFSVARNLHAHYPATEIVQLLQSKVGCCGRDVSEAEIVEAVKNSFATAWKPSLRKPKKPWSRTSLATKSSHPKWPTLDADKRENLLRSGGGLAKLLEVSPIKFGEGAEPTEEVIDRLFPGDPLLCCGKTGYEFETKPREAWRGQLAKLALVVPSPMSALTGITKTGKESAHSLNSTGPRRFLVCEFDNGTLDEQASLLLHFAGFAPMSCVVHSGGKSAHGWFFVDGQPENKVARFFRYTVSLGTDPALWTRSQFTRLPGATRDNGRRQNVLFFNPEVVK